MVTAATVENATHALVEGSSSCSDRMEDFVFESSDFRASSTMTSSRLSDAICTMIGTVQCGIEHTAGSGSLTHASVDSTQTFIKGTRIRNLLVRLIAEFRYATILYSRLS